MANENPEPGPAVPVDFRVTTYWKRRRNEPGLTQIASQRIPLSTALDWVLAELPEEALTITPDPESDTVTIRICWARVPAEIQTGKRQ